MAKGTLGLRMLELRRVRAVTLIATLAIHGGVIALLVLAGSEERAPPVARALSVFDISVSAAAPDPPKIPQPEPALPSLPRTVIVRPALTSALSGTVAPPLEHTATSANGAACDLTAPVQTALQSSEAAHAALLRIPPDRRSVANAIMVWKAAWLADDRALDPTALAVIRDVVAGTVAVAPLECRLQLQTGPRLLLLSGIEETVVLVVGSGTWRWQDLLDSAHQGSTEARALEIAIAEKNLATTDRASNAGPGS